MNVSWTLLEIRNEISTVYSLSIKFYYAQNLWSYDLCSWGEFNQHCYLYNKLIFLFIDCVLFQGDVIKYKSTRTLDFGFISASCAACGLWTISGIMMPDINVAVSGFNISRVATVMENQGKS